MLEISLRTISLFLDSIRICGGIFVTCMILCFLNRILFLGKPSEKQEKRFQKLVLFFAIYTIIFIIFEFIVNIMFEYTAWITRQDQPGSSGFVNVFKFFYSNIYGYIWIFLCIGCYVFFACVLVYAVVTGRKRRKWLGVLSFPILFGYRQMLSAVCDIPTNFLSGYSQIMARLYQVIVYILLLALLYRLSSEKYKPEFVRRMDEEARDHILSFRGEVGIWLIGIWFLTYAELVPNPTDILDNQFLNFGFSFDLPTPVVIYLSLSNLILGVVVTSLIINGSYRRLYYENNMKLQKSLISTMANLVESRDDNTGGHIHRTAKYVEIIAHRLQKQGKFTDILTDKYIADMVIAAPLHDVGKIHIPDAILNKPGKLDREEFDTMKSHSAAGGEIIQHVEDEVGEVSYLSIAEEMAKYHHERMDGSGYPHGIKGEEIPVCARILAVADVFDALISKRCYKEPMSLDTAFAIIKEETGTHFDSDIAEAFLSAREEVEAFLQTTSQDTDTQVKATENVAEQAG